MGRDKALLAYAGRPMVVSVAEVLSAAGSESVIAVGGDGAALASLGLAVVADRWPREGPLGGVITALDQFPDHDAIMVVACDMPLLSSATVRAIVEALATAADTDVAVAVTDRPQPLCAAWRPSVAAQLETAFSSGQRRLSDVLKTLRTVEVAVAARDMANVNTPFDLSD